MSFLLDTNIVAELRKPRAHPGVLSWFNAGDPLPVVDGLLAATARVHGFTLVTRNVVDFTRTEVALLNPFA